MSKGNETTETKNNDDQIFHSKNTVFRLFFQCNIEYNFLYICLK